MTMPYREVAGTGRIMNLTMDEWTSVILRR
jgi:hypothetical protein